MSNVFKRGAEVSLYGGMAHGQVLCDPGSNQVKIQFDSGEETWVDRASIEASGVDLFQAQEPEDEELKRGDRVILNGFERAIVDSVAGDNVKLYGGKDQVIWTQRKFVTKATKAQGGR